MKTCFTPTTNTRISLIKGVSMKSHSASITVEASFSLSLFLLSMIMLMTPLLILNRSIKISCLLEKNARYLSMYCPPKSLDWRTGCALGERCGRKGRGGRRESIRRGWPVQSLPQEQGMYLHLQRIYPFHSAKNRWKYGKVRRKV